MRLVLGFFGASALLLGGAIAACDSSVRVGEPKTPALEGGALGPDPDAGPLVKSWRLHAPTVPCSIYALAESQADKIWVGCTGGRVYLYDGVRAKVAYATPDEKEIFSLLHVAEDGKVWAAAQSGYDGAKAMSSLHVLDGETWTKLDLQSTRITSLGGSANELWISTETMIRRYTNGRFITEYTAPQGSTFRACSFPKKPGSGFCVGTNGLAVEWDGTTWKPIANPPWTPTAEVFGVELDPFDGHASFFFGEPYTGSNGDRTCKLAVQRGGTFATLKASTPSFTDFDVARKRTGRVNVGGQELLLLSPEAQYGGGIVFDTKLDTVNPICGDAIAFASGFANTRVGGHDGLLGRMTGTGGAQMGITQTSGSNLEIEELSVGADGIAWARASDATACGTISDQLLRFDDGTWQPVPSPQNALSGKGLTAVAFDRAYTFDITGDALFEFRSGTWRQGPPFDSPWTLWAKGPDDLWIGGDRENFGHYDGTKIRVDRPAGKLRQVQQILEVDGEIWQVIQGVTQNDTDTRVVRYQDGVVTLDTNTGLDRVNLSAIDRTHVFRSGEPAAMWNGETWKTLGFSATNVWARAADEVYFTSGGDIWLWNGTKRERVHHGFIYIRAIDGVPAAKSKDGEAHAFAVGSGGLTIELGHFGQPER